MTPAGGAEAATDTGHGAEAATDTGHGAEAATDGPTAAGGGGGGGLGAGTGLDLDTLWAAIGDPTRRRLLDVLLAQGEGTATSLAAALPVTRQAVTKHLAVLDAAGLVQARRQGREVRYVVRPTALDAATRAMASVAAGWDQRLAAIKRLAEAVARTRVLDTE